MAILLDVSVTLKADDEVVAAITETASELEFSLTLTEAELADMGVGIEDVYIIRVHNGVAEKLETYTKEGEPYTVYFKTSQFSVYALAFSWLFGDVNNNHVTYTDDLITLMRYLLGEPVSVVKGSTDINGDGFTGIGDIVSLIRWLASKTTVS